MRRIKISASSSSIFWSLVLVISIIGCQSRKCLEESPHLSDPTENEQMPGTRNPKPPTETYTYLAQEYYDPKIKEILDTKLVETLSRQAAITVHVARTSAETNLRFDSDGGPLNFEPRVLTPDNAKLILQHLLLPDHYHLHTYERMCPEPVELYFNFTYATRKQVEVYLFPACNKAVFRFDGKQRSYTTDKLTSEIKIILE